MTVTVRHVWAGRLGAGLLRLLGRTWRLEWIIDPETERLYAEHTPVLLTFWHEHILGLAYSHRRRGIVVLVSESADGEIITQIIRRLGYGTVRGSTSRGGGRAVVAALRAASEGRTLGISPDGPRGPRHVAQPGVALLAQRAQIPVVPLAVGARPCRRLRSWDRFQVPWPFARVRVVVGAPLRLAAEGATETEQALEEITRRLDEVESQALAGLEPDSLGSRA